MKKPYIKAALITGTATIALCIVMGALVFLTKWSDDRAQMTLKEVVNYLAGSCMVGLPLGIFAAFVACIAVADGVWQDN